LDMLKQRVICDLCGHEYDATRQLVKGDWSYRRSGILGAERNAQGAVPVALTLQQLDANLSRSRSDAAYTVSLNLTKSGDPTDQCEIDFAWITTSFREEKTTIVLGECKDIGPIDANEFRKHVETLRQIADSLPRKRFETFILLSKLSAFTQEEIEAARALNSPREQRVILLTERELEPYYIYDRAKKEFDIKGHGGYPRELANATAKIYFGDNKDADNTASTGKKGT